MRVYLLLIVGVFLTIVGYHVFFRNTSSRQKPLKIALSKASSSDNYAKYISWLKLYAPDAQYIDLSAVTYDGALAIIESCDGLVITGGPDVHPALYSREVDTLLCGSIDNERDALEIAMINAARRLKMPVLGICRGMQILNVAFGGSLYADIPSQFSEVVTHRGDENMVAEHLVKTMHTSNLRQLTADSGRVNSFHHQGIRELAPGFKAVAFSSDNLIEAIEYLQEQGLIVGVQWHPERMDSSNVFSKNVASWFLTNTLHYNVLKRKQ